MADDDQNSCIHTSLLLKNLGILFRWVLPGSACVEEVLGAHKIGENFDVCLIDWRMPDIDGIEVTRRVREFVGPDTTIIITAYDWTSIEESAKEAGANAFLSKPIFESSLYNALLTVIGVDGALQEHKDKESNNPALAGRHALLVEDNELNSAVELLKMAGMEIDCAGDGREALERFESSGDEYDWILMDVQMPVMDGYQATRAIRQSDHPRTKTIPIVAMTADGSARIL